MRTALAACAWLSVNGAWSPSLLGEVVRRGGRGDWLGTRGCVQVMSGSRAMIVR